MAAVVNNLTALLDHIQIIARERHRLSLGMLLQVVGTRAFGPLLLVGGLIAVSPLTGIPGAATGVGILTLAISVQMLSGASQFWIPRWLRERCVNEDRILRVVRWLRPATRIIDRLIRPRMGWVLGRCGTLTIAATCAVLGACMPVMELIPLSATIAGTVLAGFGLSIIAGDGALATLTAVFMLTMVAVIGFTLV